ncbi:MAG: tRNA (adenosine(37)-N6)-dimethylallyltransferase MiaA [Anaerolineae bacterium]|nr:tRNA (adenosine(37)-N6)-dimethylallyltransferase MiaA [Anaerolineae bacterium]
MPSPPGKPLPPVLVIVGPTAVGKTALSLDLAQRFHGEIVSADSRLFYRGMDIGTAKPSSAERATVPHHFIDICNPDETVTLGQYQDAAYATIDAILARRQLPILVGGTGQYVHAVVEGWGIPRVPPQPVLRAELELVDSAELHAQLIQLDPAAAAKIHPNNKRRLVRALEVCLVAGQPISDLQRKAPPSYDIFVLGLTCERERLYARIDARVDEMIAAGLLAEVEALHSAGYGYDLPSMSGLGYKQLGAYLRGEMGLNEAVERIKFETHRFVRHQNNWFEFGELPIAWFDVSAETYPASVHHAVANWLQRQP